MNEANAAPEMTGAVGDAKVQVIMNYQLAMARGDVTSARQAFQADVVYTVPGKSSLAGVYRGPDAVMGYLGRLMELTRGTYRISAMHWMVSDDRVSLHTVNHAERNGQSLTWNEVIVFAFRNGKKAQIELLSGDSYGFDAMFGS